MAAHAVEVKCVRHVPRHSLLSCHHHLSPVCCCVTPSISISVLTYRQPEYSLRTNSSLSASLDLAGYLLSCYLTRLFRSIKNPITSTRSQLSISSLYVLRAWQFFLLTMYTMYYSIITSITYIYTYISSQLSISIVLLIVIVQVQVNYVQSINSQISTSRLFTMSDQKLSLRVGAYSCSRGISYLFFSF